jgi:hypothetical protein
MAKTNFDDPNTLVFVPQASLDQDLVREYLEKNGPKVLAEDRMIDTAEVLSFNPNHVVVCIFRNPNVSSHGVVRNEEGKLVATLLPRAELMAQLRVTDSIAIASCWQKSGGMRAGTLDISKLLSAINSVCSPYRLYWRDPAAPNPQTLGLVL